MASRFLTTRVALACVAAALPLAAPAQTGPATSGQVLHAGTLTVPINKSQVVNADRAIAKAMIGNDQIADILPLTDRSIYVLGKRIGTTSLTLYDARGRVIAVMDVAVGPDIETLQSQLKILVPGEDIQAHISNDSIVLTGMVSSPAAADRAVQLARTYVGDYDDKGIRKSSDAKNGIDSSNDRVVNLISVGSSQQVMLEVTFAEVDKTSGKEFGISAFGSSRNGSFGSVTGNGTSLVPDPTSGLGVLKLDQITGQAGVFTQTLTLGSLSLQGILNALESKGMARTLAKPTLIALSGEKASFLAGGEFPIPVAQSGTLGNTRGATFTVEFKTFGVSLAFTPTVLSDSTINMIVAPEVSEIDPSASLSINGISVPGLRTRRVSTTLELRDGESFAIAGLLQQDTKVNISQLPVLGSIPILGTLFRSTRYQKGETELLIIVTPRLVAPIKPSQVRLPTDRVKDPNDVETFLLGQPYQPQPLPPIAPSGAKPPAGDPESKTPPKKDDGYGF